MTKPALVLAALAALAAVGACSPPAAGVDLRALAAAPVLATAHGVSLVALTAPAGPDDSDVRMPRPMALRDERSGTLTPPPAPVLAGALVDDAAADAVWVTTDGALVVTRGDDVRVVDTEVIPELSLRGARVAFAKPPTAAHPGVYVADLAAQGPPVLVTPGLAFADRPLFVDDDTLVVGGAVPSGIAGIWLAHVDGRPPLAVTNGALHTGRPLGPNFVPPPASHESMRVVVEDGARVLRYFDGRREQRVVLP